MANIDELTHAQLILHARQLEDAHERAKVKGVGYFAFTDDDLASLEIFSPSAAESLREALKNYKDAKAQSKQYSAEDDEQFRTLRPTLKHVTSIIEKTLDAHREGDILRVRVAQAVSFARTAVLARRVAELEGEVERRGEVKYCGTYKPDESYSPGHLVTKSGGLWLCLKQTRATPGSDHAGWRLIVKSGEAR